MYLNALGLFLRVHVRGQMDAFEDRLQTLARRLTDRVSYIKIPFWIQSLHKICCIKGPNIFGIKILGKFTGRDVLKENIMYVCGFRILYYDLRLMLVHHMMFMPYLFRWCHPLN